jgi:hypothetical protein
MKLAAQKQWVSFLPIHEEKAKKKHISQLVELEVIARLLSGRYNIFISLSLYSSLLVFYRINPFAHRIESTINRKLIFLFRAHHLHHHQQQHHTYGWPLKSRRVQLVSYIGV